jgi:peptidoglycan biosynthesis protein MviN/MurJ (putative lipid II flippase)
MSPPPFAVAAFWGVLNGALVAVLAGFGAKPALLALYGSAAALVELAALAVWLYQRREHRRGRPATANGDSVLLFALGVMIVGLGWVFYWPLAIISILPFLFALRREVTTRRRSA